MPISLKANSDGSAEILNGVQTVLKINNDNSLEAQGSLLTSELVSNTWKNVDGTENYKCKCWVNFDGTTTPPTIRASGNVSSVVRNAIGNYTVNFETPMEDASYSAIATQSRLFSGNATSENNRSVAIGSQTPNSCDIGTYLDGTGAENHKMVAVSIFR